MPSLSARNLECVKIHAKTITIDSKIGAVGTMNMDIRSLQLHMEPMGWIDDAGQVRVFEGSYERDMTSSREVTLDEVRARSRGTRTKYSAARLLSNLL